MKVAIWELISQGVETASREQLIEGLRRIDDVKSFINDYFDDYELTQIRNRLAELSKGITYRLALRESSLLTSLTEPKP
jgi:hypothetical protein